MSDELTDAIGRLDAGLSVVPIGPLRDMLVKSRNRASGGLTAPPNAALAVADALAAQGQGILDQLRDWLTRQESLEGNLRMSDANLAGAYAAVGHVEDIVAGRVRRWVS